MKEILPGLWDVDEIGPMVHVYLWEWEGGVSLIDTGVPGNETKILDGVRRIGYQPSDIKRLIVTHADIDHVGSLKAIKRITHAPVACHTVEKALLEHPERRRPSGTPLASLISPVFALMRLAPALRVEPVSPDEIYVDGDRLPEGFVMIHTPGHTPGHVSLLHPEKRFLIAGDALNTRTGPLSGPPPIFTPDMDNAHRSIWKLWKKYGADYDTIVFGHGDPIRENASAAVKGLVDQIYETEPGRAA
jgi:glyoxylase-like metal-dependent hydrolase (beta-lactamase superfamily II)